MKNLKAGFAIRTMNKDLPDDKLIPKELLEHNQATLDYLSTIQATTDESMDGGEFPCSLGR